MLRRGMLGRIAAELPGTSTRQLVELRQNFPRVILQRAYTGPRAAIASSNSLSSNRLRGCRSYATSQGEAGIKATPTKTRRASPKSTAPRSTEKRATTKSKAKPAKAKKSKKKASGKTASRVKAKKRPVTEKQKKAKKVKEERETIKALRKQALDAPSLRHASAYAIYFGEAAKGKSMDLARASQSAAEFKALTPAELEHYNHIANQRKAAEEAAYQSWVKSHTPEQIRLANIARAALRRKIRRGKGGRSKIASYQAIRDERQVKRPVSPYLLFTIDRRASGDFKNIPVPASAKLIAEEFKSLSASDKKKYADLAASDLERYHREYANAYGHSSPSIRSTPSVNA